MSFVWRGGGIVTLIILFSGALIAHSLFPDNRLALAAAFFIGALVNWIIGVTLNRQLRNAGVAPLKRHWLFLVPMEWWSLAFLAVAAAVAGRALRNGFIAALLVAMSFCALIPNSADARDWQSVDGFKIEAPR